MKQQKNREANQTSRLDHSRIDKNLMNKLMAIEHKAIL